MVDNWVTIVGAFHAMISSRGVTALAQPVSSSGQSNGLKLLLEPTGSAGEITGFAGRH